MIKPSIKRFLLFNLLLSITITSSFTAIGSYFLEDIDIQKQLDIHLKQSSKFINAILIKTHVYPKVFNKNYKDTVTTHTLKEKKLKNKDPYTKGKFQFQILDNRGNTLLYSSKNFNIPLANIKDGFSTQKVGNEIWRIYTEHHDDSNTIFSIGELYTLRAQLEQRVTLDNLIIILWTYPILGLLIWLTVSRGLNTFKKITLSLANRSATNFEPIDLENIPIEIQPLVEELNKLFLRLQHEFERNKRFASDAAHELRTPLAALKTQTQVALLAITDTKEREAALNKILQGVDRCIHLVQQLLILSRLTKESISEDFYPTNLYKILSEVLAELTPYALEKNIEIALLDSNKRALIYGNETTLSILIRNLVNNAIRYIPNNGIIEAKVTKKYNQVILRITDNGPGISPELRKRVFERFYRILGTKTQGSGLGLAIVKQIADLHHATIKLGTPKTGQGLEVEIIFPTVN